MREYDDSDDGLELERYLSGEMSPEEAGAFALLIERDPELRSMIEADRMLRRVIDADLRSMPPSSIASRERIAQTARSAPRRTPPEIEARAEGGSRAWIAALVCAGLLIAIAFIIGGNGSEVPNSSAGTTASRTDTLRRVDTASRRTSAPARASRPNAARSMQAAQRHEPTSSLPASDLRSTAIDSSSPPLRSPAVDTAAAAQRIVHTDSAHIPLTISPARINHPREPDGKP